MIVVCSAFIGFEIWYICARQLMVLRSVAICSDLVLSRLSWSERLLTCLLSEMNSSEGMDAVMVVKTDFLCCKLLVNCVRV